MLTNGKTHALGSQRPDADCAHARLATAPLGRLVSVQLQILDVVDKEQLLKGSRQAAHGAVAVTVTGRAAHGEHLGRHVQVVAVGFCNQRQRLLCGVQHVPQRGALKHGQHAGLQLGGQTRGDGAQQCAERGVALHPGEAGVQGEQVLAGVAGGPGEQGAGRHGKAHEALELVGEG